MERFSIRKGARRFGTGRHECWQAMTDWANHDAHSKRVPSDWKRDVFRAKEISVDTGVPAPFSHASLEGVEYRDVHAIDQPDLGKTFKALPQMQRWFTDHVAGVKGTTRSD